MYQRILHATDFSPTAASALEAAVWTAQKAGCALVLASVISDIRSAMAAASYEAPELIYGDPEKFQRALRKDAERQLQETAARFRESGVAIQCETLLGIPFVEITHAVQKEGFDLVVAGTRGQSKFKQFLLGSTAKRLIQNCPSNVSIVREGRSAPPKTVLVPIDFSELSARALRHGAWVAEQAGAELLVLHVIDAMDVPDDLIQKADENPQHKSMRQNIRVAAKDRMQQFMSGHLTGAIEPKLQISWGDPWREIDRVVEKSSVDLVAMGTVGRSGVKGLLLGNTAERVLDNCPCNILTVKPADFVSPIDPPFWELHAAPETPAGGTYPARK